MSDDPETSESSSTEEEEDENAKEWTEEVEKTFLKTLCSLKQKDPKIYDENVKFFKEDLISSNRAPIQKKEDTMYLKDYERKIILEKNGILTDEESDDEASLTLKQKRAQSPTYVEEQRTLKEDFKKYLDDEGSEEDEDGFGFLKPKKKTQQEKAKEEEEYVEWLKGQKSEISDKDTESQLKYLRDYWTDPKLNEGEQFIRDYILNKRYLETDESQQEEEVTFSEEEKILEECDEYEEKYNFRFEEPDKNFIKTYPRVIESSLRRKDEKRKEKREALKKRKEEQVEQKRIEVKKLKKQKKQELLDRIKKLKEITGNQNLGFSDQDLENDFNPDEYDKKMSQLFNEEFYELEEMNGEKPKFDDSESDYEYNGVTDDSAESPTDDAEDSKLIMDCDYDPEKTKESKFKKQSRSARKKGHKKLKAEEVSPTEKPVFNAEERTFQQYLDEYYAMDFEDMVGDLPVRYEYRKVIPNSYGLTVDEILAADDKELNAWCSMRKIDTILPENVEKFDVKIYSRKGNDINLKRKLLPSLFANEQESEPTDANSAKKKKKRKRNKVKNADKAEQSAVNINNSQPKNTNKKRKAQNDSNQNAAKKAKMSLSIKTDTKTCESKTNSKKIKFKNEKWKKQFSNNNKGNDIRSDNCEFSNERLKAYGINPKRYKNKLKYAPK